jgi:predicted dehydrogenase
MLDNVAHFVECVRTHTQPETGGAEGTAVVRILEAMTQSAANNGAMVEL